MTATWSWTCSARWTPEEASGSPKTWGGPGQPAAPLKWLSALAHTPNRPDRLKRTVRAERLTGVKLTPTQEEHTHTRKHNAISHPSWNDQSGAVCYWWTGQASQWVFTKTIPLVRPNVGVERPSNMLVLLDSGVGSTLRCSWTGTWPQVQAWR